eukprot:NODE_19033_length_863_cov_4.126359.p1 GENE.NODE_19033_length_863_cov_4.126359~~NODE_19033_length_863_cov_4.126359.p1  ORF type:complete len:195 (+),score=26.39 NODE_19033_length_863_cov_4.126359:140-724(+)
MPILIPKKVALHNGKLMVMWRLLLLSSCASLLAWLIIGKEYIVYLNGDIEAVIWPMPPTAAADDAEDCASAEWYEFCDTPTCDGDNVFINMTCLPRCDGDFRDASCVHPDEVMQWSARFQTLNIATSFFQEYFGTGPNVTLPEESMHIVRDTALYTFGVWFEMITAGSDFMSSFTFTAPSPTFTRSSPRTCACS